MIQIITGAPKRALTVEMGSGYVKSEQSTSHTSNRHAPISTQAGMVTRWFEVLKMPRAICGTATPINAIGPQKAVTPPASNPVAITMNRRVRST